MPGEAIRAGASIVGGVIGASGAEDAADTAQDGTIRAAEINAEAQQAAIDEQRRQFDFIQGAQGPARGVGYNALYAMSDMMGLPRRFGSQDFFTDFSNQSQQLNPNGDGNPAGDAGAAGLADVFSNIQWESPKNARTAAAFEEMSFIYDPDSQTFLSLGRKPGSTREDVVNQLTEIAGESSDSGDFFRRLNNLSNRNNNYGGEDYTFGVASGIQTNLADIDRGRTRSDLTGLNEAVQGFNSGGSTATTQPVTDANGVPLSGNALTGTPAPTIRANIGQQGMNVANNVMQNTGSVMNNTQPMGIGPTVMQNGGFY